jgi:hypothetical protein
MIVWDEWPDVGTLGIVCSHLNLISVPQHWFVSIS